MKSSHILSTVIAGSTLISLTLGAILFILDFFVVNLAERFAEVVGLIPQGWTDSHLDWTVNAALLLTLPLLVGLFVLTWRQIMRVETALAQPPADVAQS